MSFLVLTTRPPTSRQSGYDLRVVHLCAHLPGEAHLVIAAQDPVETPTPEELGGVFASTEVLPPLSASATSARRHLRSSDDHVGALTHPAAFARARDRLRAIARERGITRVVAFDGEVAELAATLDDLPAVLDVCDSAALTIERALAAGPGSRKQRIKERLKLHRKRATESRFPERFERVVAISRPDARAVERGRPEGTVAVVPNGVDEAFVGPLPEPGTRRGIVFWGNLTFAPNREALRFLVREVWQPHLREAGVELAVVGAGAPSWLTELAADEPGIVLTGYVEDLRPVVARYPIMINAMRTGSGLKNKVLEAFGLGLVVVSTPLGVEAITEIEDGTHAVLASDADGLAGAVRVLLDDEPRRARIRTAARALVETHYRWEAVARTWRTLLGADQTGAPHPRR